MNNKRHLGIETIGYCSLNAGSSMVGLIDNLADIVYNAGRQVDFGEVCPAVMSGMGSVGY